MLDIDTPGLPAISADGSKIVFDDLEVDDASTDDSEGIFTVQWQDAHTGKWLRSETVYDSATFREAERAHPDKDPCVAYERSAKRVAKRINAALHTEGWRPLLELDVVLTDPYDDSDDYKRRIVDPLTIEPAIRPVEMYWFKGRLIARTRRVKVYMDVPAPWADEEESEYDEESGGMQYPASPCDAEPSLERVYGDAVSGVLMVVYDYDRTSTSCLCDSIDSTDIIRAPPELFERLEVLARRAPPPPVAD